HLSRMLRRAADAAPSHPRSARSRLRRFRQEARHAGALRGAGDERGTGGNPQTHRRSQQEEIMNTINALLSEPVVTRIGWTLVHSIWQLAVIAIVAKLLLRAMDRAAANARYLFSCAAMAL